MLPILFSLGSVKIYSYGVVLAIGLFLSLYFWWKMGRDEHWDEITLFDGFFLTLIMYLVAGRLGYVLSHFSELGSVYRSLAILVYPGISTIIGTIAASIFMYLFARAQSWQEWRVADAYVVALSLVLVFGAIGAILNGSNPVLAVNIWGLVWAIGVFLIVSRVRKNFRFYSWYKGESSTAQEGLACLIFGDSIGIYYVVRGMIDQLNWKIGIVPYESLIGIGVVVLCVYLINKRVGRREHTLWGKLSNIIRRK